LLFAGETIRNWRPRYFYLFDDGSFLGFKGGVENPLGTEPLNNFTVRGCQIMKMDRPKAFTFMIRGLSPNRTLERSFCTDSEKERQEWFSCIMTVSGSLGPGLGPNNSQQPPQMHHLALATGTTSMPTYSQGSTAWMEGAGLASSGTVSENKMITGTPVGSLNLIDDNMSIGSSHSSSHMDVDLSNKFQVQGVSHPRGSGIAKVVSSISKIISVFS
jgi:hypothetical protein